jgi:hypothetical protein
VMWGVDVGTRGWDEQLGHAMAHPSYPTMPWSPMNQGPLDCRHLSAQVRRSTPGIPL